jgi:hypothetical protein
MIRLRMRHRQVDVFVHVEGDYVLESEGNFVRRNDGHRNMDALRKFSIFEKLDEGLVGRDRRRPSGKTKNEGFLCSWLEIVDARLRV